MPPNYRPRREKQVDADDFVIKIVAALVLVFVAARVLAWYRHSAPVEGPAQLQVAAGPDVRTSTGIPENVGRSAQSAVEQGQMEVDRVASASEQLIYKCQTSRGIQLQSLPCAPSETTAWVRSASPESPSEDDLRRQAQLRQHEADVARYTRMYGDNANQGYTNAYPQANPLQQSRARCQAAKDNREAVLKIVGLQRTFDLLRQLDDAVYEACKGT